MKVLAIEISSARGSVAVAENGRVVAERRFACERGRGVEFFTALESLREVWKNADTIAVGIGPGSYNGLRTACALANSLHLAGGASLRAVPSPCLLPTAAEHFFVCGDARGGRAYRAEVRKRRLVGDISLITHHEAAALAGGAVPAFRVGALPGAEHLPEAAPEAGVLAMLAPDCPVQSEGHIGPIYLKPPHITRPRGAGPGLPRDRTGC